MGKVLCIDPGSKRVGLAISDQNRKIAFPLKVIVITTVAALAAEIKTILEREKVSLVIIGSACGTDQQKSAAARLGELIGEKLYHLTGVAVEYVDETLTSVDAEEVFISAGVSRKKRKGKIDMVAAAMMLKEYLERGQNPVGPGAKPS